MSSRITQNADSTTVTYGYPPLLMDLTYILESIPSLLEEYATLLEGKTIVACLGNTRWLGAFICINPITKHVVGACTTEDEGYRHVLRNRPDFLIVSETLHDGTGVSLVKRAEQFCPSIRTILITNRQATAVIGEALEAGCDAICFETEDFTPVFRIVAGGGGSIIRRKLPMFSRGKNQKMTTPHSLKSSLNARSMFSRG